MNIMLAKALAGVAVMVALGFAWAGFVKHEQAIGYQKAVAEYEVKLAEAKEVALSIERGWNKVYQEAQNAATQREAKNRVAVAAAAGAANSLRNTIADLRRRLSTASRETCVVTADAFAAVFDDCQADYRALAEVADRHASDAEALRQAWPQ